MKDIDEKKAKVNYNESELEVGPKRDEVTRVMEKITQ